MEKYIKVGMGKENISPKKPTIGRIGINHIIKPFHAIYSKAVAFEYNNKLYLNIVCEVVGLTKKTNEKIKEQIVKKCKINKENIIITSTHTHSSPWIWEIQAEEAKKEGLQVIDYEWFDKFINNTISAGIKAINNLDEVIIKYGEAKVKDVAYNRVQKSGEKGFIDPYVRTISIYNKDGKIKGILANYSCHLNAFGGGDTKRISPDFTYYTEKELLKEYNEDVMLFYWQGFAGNINTGSYSEKGKIEKVKEIGLRFAEGIKKAINKSNNVFEKEISITYKYKNFFLPTGDFIKPVDEARKVFIEKTNEIKKTQPDYNAVYWWRVTIKKLDVSIISEENGMEIEVQILKLNKTWIIFLPGEWFVEIYFEIKRKFKDINLIVVTLNNFDLLYIPSKEAMSHKDWYGVDKRMRTIDDEAVKTLIQKVKLLLE